MTEFDDDFIKWENGSSNDPVRNEFIIPKLIEIIRKEKPNNILDLGCATGYIARKVNSKLDYSPEWLLVDSKSEHLVYAKSKNVSKFNYLCSDIFNLKIDPFKMVVLSFTLLEFVLNKNRAQSLANKCSNNGLMIIFLPDTQQDILREVESHGKLKTLSEFTETHVNISKIDKFTDTKYPFIAQRMCFIIKALVQCGFHLIDLELREISGKRFFCIIFKKLRHD